MSHKRENLKYLAALALLVSFFLPMSSCSYTVPLEMGGEGAVPESGGPRTETRTVTMYAREFIDFREPGSWFNVLSFLWPMFVIPLQLRFRGPRARILLPTTGASFAVVSAVVIYLWADVGKPLIGAYVGGCAAAGLLVAYLMELVEAFRKGKDSKRRLGI